MTTHRSADGMSSAALVHPSMLTRFRVPAHLAVACTVCEAQAREGDAVPLATFAIPFAIALCGLHAQRHTPFWFGNTKGPGYVPFYINVDDPTWTVVEKAT